MEQKRGNTYRLMSLGKAIEGVLQQCGLEHLGLLQRLVQRWPEIAGTRLALVSQPLRIQFQVLFISVTDAIWHQQILFYQAQLLCNIHQILGTVPITKLHFTLASSASSSQAPSPSPLPEATPSLPLTSEEERQIHEGTAAIADPGLREAVKQAWRRGWQIRR